MQRWHLTTGLGVAVLAAAALAPTLRARTVAPPTPVAPPVEVVVAPAPVAQGPLQVTARLDGRVLAAHATEQRYLAVEVTAPRDNTTRVPVDMVALIDTSGSMRARHKIDYAIESTRVLAASLHPEDRLSIVTFDSDATTVLPLTSVGGSYVASQALGAIEASGGTNLYGGLVAAGVQLRNASHSGRARRVLLLSDGEPTSGITNPRDIAQIGASLAQEGITVSALGLGLEFNEDLLANLSDAGGGTYAWMDNPSELQSIFHTELTRTAALTARDTTVDIVLPPEVEPLELFGWEAERTANGWRVRIGDISAGDSLSILASVRVRTGDERSAGTVASVQADYLDLKAERRSSSSAQATVAISRDSALAQASMDPEVLAAGYAAHVTTVQQKTANLFTRGDRAGAVAVMRESEALLREAPSKPMAAPVARALDERQAMLQDLSAPTASAADESTLLKSIKGSARTSTRHALTPEGVR